MRTSKTTRFCVFLFGVLLLGSLTNGFCKDETTKFIERNLLNIEELLEKNSLDEALALTYELLPDKQAEKKSGLETKSKPVKTTEGQRIGIYLLRAKAYSLLNKEGPANEALLKAEFLLNQEVNTLSDHEQIIYKANLAFRKLQLTGYFCNKKVPTPQKLSEAEFLDYTNRFYECLKPIQSYFCSILAAKSEQPSLVEKAKPKYQNLLESPLKLTQKLPPPARKLKTKSQRKFYEFEMRTLIQNTVSRKIRPFKKIESCDYVVF